VSSEFSAQQYAMMARLVPGSQLAGYVIEEQIGAGGMAVVFRARDGMLGRLAALKVLSPALAADQEFRARFLRESQAVASVEEPHIIPVYGAGEADGVLYIATKFVSGGDLAGVLQRAGGALEPERAAAFIDQVAAALDAAHALPAGAGLHQEALAMAVSRLRAPDTTPSARVLQAMEREHDKSYVRFVLAQSQRHRDAIWKLRFAADVAERFTRLAEGSLVKQRQIETADTIPFETYRQQYLAPERLNV
jgi:hypothetical protein